MLLALKYYQPSSEASTMFLLYNLKANEHNKVGRTTSQLRDSYECLITFASNYNNHAVTQWVASSRRVTAGEAQVRPIKRMTHTMKQVTPVLNDSKYFSFVFVFVFIYIVDVLKFSLPCMKGVIIVIIYSSVKENPVQNMTTDHFKTMSFLHISCMFWRINK